MPLGINELGGPTCRRAIEVTVRYMAAVVFVMGDGMINEVKRSRVTVALGNTVDVSGC